MTGGIRLMRIVSTITVPRQCMVVNNENECSHDPEHSKVHTLMFDYSQHESTVGSFPKKG